MLECIIRHNLDWNPSGTNLTCVFVCVRVLRYITSQVQWPTVFIVINMEKMCAKYFCLIDKIAVFLLLLVVSLVALFGFWKQKRRTQKTMYIANEVEILQTQTIHNRVCIVSVRAYIIKSCVWFWGLKSLLYSPPVNHQAM